MRGYRLEDLYVISSVYTSPLGPVIIPEEKKAFSFWCYTTGY